MQYDFDLADGGSSSTGMRLCTYKVEIRKNAVGTESTVFVESPGLPDEEGWEVAKVEPVSEGSSGFSDLLKPSSRPFVTLYLHDLLPAFKEIEQVPSLASLSIASPAPPPAAKDGPSARYLAALSNPNPTPASSDPSASPSAHLPPPTSLLTYALLILRTPSPARKVSLTREALAFLRSLPPDQPLVTREEAKWAASVIGDDTPPREEGKGGVKAPGRMGKRGKGGSEKSRGLMLHALAAIEQWGESTLKLVALPAAFSTELLTQALRFLLSYRSGLGRDRSLRHYRNQWPNLTPSILHGKPFLRSIAFLLVSPLILMTDLRFCFVRTGRKWLRTRLSTSLCSSPCSLNEASLSAITQPFVFPPNSPFHSSSCLTLRRSSFKSMPVSVRSFPH
jgi:hypothetical protein